MSLISSSLVLSKVVLFLIKVPTYIYLKITKLKLVQGENDIEQLAMVLHNLGTPTNQSWPSLKDLPDYNKITFPPSKGKLFEELVPDADSTCINLIKSFIRYDGSKRLPARKVSSTIFYWNRYSFLVFWQGKKKKT